MQSKPSAKTSAHKTGLSLVAYEHSSFAPHVRSKESWLFLKTMLLVASSILFFKGQLQNDQLHYILSLKYWRICGGYFP